MYIEVAFNFIPCIQILIASRLYNKHKPPPPPSAHFQALRKALCKAHWITEFVVTCRASQECFLRKTQQGFMPGKKACPPPPQCCLQTNPLKRLWTSIVFLLLPFPCIIPKGIESWFLVFPLRKAYQEGLLRCITGPNNKQQLVALTERAHCKYNTPTKTITTQSFFLPTFHRFDSQQRHSKSGCSCQLHDGGGGWFQVPTCFSWQTIHFCNNKKLCQIRSKGVHQLSGQKLLLTSSPKWLLGLHYQEQFWGVASTKWFIKIQKYSII